MKKLKFLSIALMSAMAVMSGCSKDDDKADSLNGTSWLYEDDEKEVAL